MKKDYKLYSVFPMYLAVVFSKLFLIPLVGYFFIDAIFTLVVTFLLFKRFKVAFYFKTLYISYIVEVSATFLAVFLCFVFQELLFPFSPNAPVQQKVNYRIFVTVFAFVLSSALIFCVNFFVNYGVMNKLKPFRKALKLWQRLTISISLTLLNAPYALLFVRDEWLEQEGYIWFYNTF